MGIRTLLREIAPIATRVLEGVEAPTHPSEVAAGIDLRPWRERYRPEVVALLDAVIEGAWLIARVDGSVDRAERRVLSEVIRAVARDGLRADDIDDLLDQAATRLLRDGLSARCDAVGRTLAGAGFAEAGLRVATAVAAASNGVSLAEGVSVTAIARAAGLDDVRADAIVRETLATLAAPD